MLAEGQRVAVGDTDVDPVSVMERVGVCVVEAVRQRVDVPDWDAVTEGLRDEEPHTDMVVVTENDRVAVEHDVGVVESVMERVGVGVAVDVRHNDGEPELEGEAEGQCDTVAVTEAQREAEGEPELLTVSVGVMEGVYVRLPVGLAEAEREAEGHADDDREPEAQPLPVGEIVEVRHSEGVPD